MIHCSTYTTVIVLLLYIPLNDEMTVPNFLCLVISFVGLIILSNPFELIFKSKSDDIMPILFLMLSMILLSVSKKLTTNIQQSLPLSCGKFIFHFTLLLLLPGIIIITSSVNESSSLVYNWQVMIYLLINSLLSYLALYMLVKVFQFDKSHKLEFFSYLMLIYPLVANWVLGHIYDTDDQIDFWEFDLKEGIAVSIVLTPRMLYYLANLWYDEKVD